MSTLELPASIALIIVMAILALCLAADSQRQAPRSIARPAVAAMTGITNCEVSNDRAARHSAAEASRLKGPC